MNFRWYERLTGFVIWPRNRDPRIKGPQPRIITIEQARCAEEMHKHFEGKPEAMPSREAVARGRAMERHRKEMESGEEGEDEVAR